MNKSFVLLLSAIGLLAVGCAQQDPASEGKKAEEYITLYMESFYPDVARESSGIYILEDTPGSGELWDDDLDYIYASITVRDLGGTITSTRDEKLAKQLGTYATFNYYGPVYQHIGENFSYAGLDAMLDGMRIGGTRTAILPAWLVTTSRCDSKDAYLKACTKSTNHLMYTVTLAGQTDDIDETEKQQIEDYLKKAYGTAPAPVSFKEDVDPDGSFYFISDVSGFDPDDERSSDATLKLNYTGRLLTTGQIFDTTDEKLAKDIGIYSASRTYEPVTITFSDNWDSIAMNGNSTTLIDGFQGGLSLMKWSKQKATIIFISALGYTSSGSGNIIPPYAPLIFDLELLDNN